MVYDSGNLNLDIKEAAIRIYSYQFTIIPLLFLN